MLANLVLTVDAVSLETSLTFSLASDSILHFVGESTESMIGSMAKMWPLRKLEN